MNLSTIVRTPAQNQAVLKPAAAKIAILIAVLSAIFYTALSTATNPLAAVNSLATPAAISYLDTAPPNPASLALQESQAATWVQPTPQRVPGDFPNGHVYPPNSENGNVMTYEHD